MSNFPKYFSIQTTSLCNASCVFCPYKKIEKLFPPRIMDTALFNKIIDESSQYKNIERIILYMNNEPLTDPHIIERINYTKEKVPWASVHILTNGLLLTDEMRKELINSKLDWIGISFHGIKKETIKKAMGINFDMAFERINKFIEEAKKRKNIDEYIMITFLKHKYLTDEEKEEAIKYWKKKGLQRISYFAGPISRAGNVGGLPSVYHAGKIVGCNSIWAEEMLHIVEDGKVVLCCMDWKREVILGDLNKESVFDIWNGKRKKIWDMILGREDMSSDFLCRRCEEAIIEEEKNSVLLVDLPPWGADTPYLDIACLATYLNANKISARVFDFNIELYNLVSPEYKYLWSMNYAAWWRDKFNFIRGIIGTQIDILIERLVYSPQKIVAFSLPSNWPYMILKESIKRIKEQDPNKIIILGGVSVSIKEQRSSILENIEKYVDYCVAGEGEEALYRIAKSIFEGKDLGKIKGVLLRDSFFAEGERAGNKSLADLPFPSFEEFDLRKYMIKNSLPIEFSRGCVANCPFCSFRVVSPKLKVKPAYYIVEQIRYYIEKYDIEHLTIVDPAVNSDPKTLEELCGLLIESGITIKLSALAIPRKEMNYNLLRKMKQAGFYRLEYGVESGSNKVLRLMRKTFTSEIAERVIKDTYKAGISVYLYFIVGFPGEGEKEFNETKIFLERISLYITAVISINPLYVMAGSELFYHPRKYGIIIPNIEGDRRWFIPEENNNFDVRRNKVLQLKEWANKLNIKFMEGAESLEFTTEFIRERKERFNIYNAGNKAISNNIDFLLINLPPWAQENPHIGVGYLCEYLRRQGLNPAVLDLNKRFFSNHSDFRMLWHVENKNFWSNENTFPLILDVFKADIESAIEEIDFYGCEILGFSVVDPKERLTIELIRRIKRKYPYKKIILGGPATSTEEQRKIFIDNIPGLIDVFVAGEGEKVLFSLIERMKNSSDIGAVKGIIFKKDNNWIDNGLYLQDISDIPFPTYKEFDMDKYGKSLLVEWSRGCIGNCAFCKNWRLFGGYRPKDIDKIIAELKYHIDRYNIREFTVVDNILNGNVKLLKGICERIIKDGLNITWSGQIAPRREMSFEVFEKMKRAGCECLQIGVESGSDKVLKRMRKIYTSEIAERNIRNAKKAGIKTEVFIIIGFPSEGRKEFMQTYNFIRRNRKWIDTIKSINTLHLIAGTDVYEKREEFGIKPLPSENWHYLWETYDGNKYTVRKKRAQKILNLAWDLGIKVMETNIKEGKENIFKVIKEKSPQGKIELLKSSINELQELSKKRIEKKRSFLKYFILISLSSFVLFYIIYFWMYMIIRNKVLLGGRKD